MMALTMTMIAIVQEQWTLPKWTLAVAMSDLSASRADWLVEKATELGAWALLPFISQHSHKGGEGQGWVHRISTDSNICRGN